VQDARHNSAVRRSSGWTGPSRLCPARVRLKQQAFPARHRSGRVEPQAATCGRPAWTGRPKPHKPRSLLQVCHAPGRDARRDARAWRCGSGPLRRPSRAPARRWSSLRTGGRFSESRLPLLTRLPPRPAYARHDETVCTVRPPRPPWLSALVRVHALPFGRHAPRSAPPAALRLRFRYALRQLMSPARESSCGLGRACRALEAGARSRVRSVVVARIVHQRRMACPEPKRIRRQIAGRPPQASLGRSVEEAGA
jgi:hypothetical protein